MISARLYVFLALAAGVPVHAARILAPRKDGTPPDSANKKAVARAWPVVVHTSPPGTRPTPATHTFVPTHCNWSARAPRAGAFRPNAPTDNLSHNALV